MVGILSLLTLFLSPQANAHPVTFEGGTMLRSLLRGDMSESAATYTFHRLLAVGLGVDTLMLHQQDSTWSLAEFNARPFRWNSPDSQSNIYLITGFGDFKDKFREEWAGKIGIQVDHETREFFSMIKYQKWFTKNVESQMTMVQLGFAPFTAGYNDLNIWALVQMDYNKDMRKNIQVTPLLRFFYKNVYWEIGSSTAGNFYGSLMVHL